ncbi:AcvB/VirJ family lysyl-phosphatidylglycerol hydrolase [Aestuariivirga sp.]|uniref:AcvB/VirJ family lysyl-phosphatidylglycerol hydrolase n=1 Tax=Aestuariivirga sp. TaxID=2650926 RepID=UPI0039E245C3
MTIRRFLCGCSIAAGLAGLALPLRAEVIDVPTFGKVTIERPQDTPTSVTILLSDTGGWSTDESAIAAKLAQQGTLVIGVESSHLIDGHEGQKSCLYPAGQLQTLAQSVEKKEGLGTYFEPAVTGIGLGASLAYVALAEAPQNTFAGGAALRFDPARTFAVRFCKGEHLPHMDDGQGAKILGQADALQAPFTFVVPQSDEARFTAFTDAMENSLVSPVADEALAADPAAAMLAALQQAGAAAATPPATADTTEVADFPITEVRDEQATEGDTLAIFLSGDGGWASLDDGVSELLAAKGIPVVGVSSLKYFWQARTPDDVGRDISTIAAYYLKAWNKKHILLVGYSFGADAMPFVATRLAGPVKDNLSGLALIGPSHAATFEFHVSGWLIDDTSGTPTLPEVKKLAGLPIACIYGSDETDSLCSDLSGRNVSFYRANGSHHLDGDYDGAAAAIVALTRV